jgi:hypothetical protein
VLVESQGPDDVSDATLTVDLALQALAGEPGPQLQISAIEAPDGWDCQAGSQSLQCGPLDIAAYSAARVTFSVTVDRPAGLSVDAGLSSAVEDPLGGNNAAILDIEIDTAGRIFVDGFEGF